MQNSASCLRAERRLQRKVAGKCSITERATIQHGLNRTDVGGMLSSFQDIHLITLVNSTKEDSLESQFYKYVKCWRKQVNRDRRNNEFRAKYKTKYPLFVPVHTYLFQGCTQPRREVVWETKFCVVTLNIFWSSV